MATTVADLMVKFGSSGVAQTKGDIESVGGSVDNAGAKSKLAGAALAGLGAIVAVAGKQSLGAFIGFDAQMQNVNSIAQLSTSEINALSKEVLTLAGDPRIAQGPATLAAGLYDIQSSGFSGADAMNVLEKSAIAATAGMTTTDVSARAISASLNAYGLDASEAGRVSDVLFQTVNEGVITFDQLANNMGNTLPIASSLGIGIEELGAAYAQMTLKGVGASQAETQISALMRTALNPRQQLTDAMNQYGYASATAAIESEGLAGFLKIVTDAAGGNQEALFEMLGTQEAMNAATILGANGGEDYAASLARMMLASDGAGATNKALAKQMQSLQFKIDKAKVSMQRAAIVIGGMMAPAVGKLADLVAKAANAFFKFSPTVQKVIAALVGVAGVIAGVAGAILLLAGPIGAGVAAFGGLSGIMGVLAGTIFPVIAALGLLYAAYKTNFLGFGDGVRMVVGWIGDAFNAVTLVISEFTRYMGLIQVGMNPVSDAMHSLGMALNTVLGVGNKFSVFLITTSRLLHGFVAYLRGSAGSTEYLRGRIAMLPPAFQPVVLAIGLLVDAAADLVRAFQAGGLRGLIAALPGELAQLADGFKALGGAILGAIRSLDWGAIGREAFTLLQGAAQAALAGGINLGNVIASVASWIAAGAATLAAKVLGYANTLFDGDLSLGNVTATIAGWLVAAGAGLASLVTKVTDYAKSLLPNDVSIGSITIAIGGWLVSLAAGVFSVESKVLEYVYDTFDREVSIFDVTINILGWTIQAAVSLYAALIRLRETIQAGFDVLITAYKWQVKIASIAWDFLAPDLSFLAPLKTAFNDIVSAVSTAAASIGRFVDDTGAKMSGLWESAKQGPNDLLGWFNSVAEPISMAAATIGRFADDVGAKMSGLWDAAKRGPDDLLGWFASVAVPISAAAVTFGRFADDIAAKFSGLWEAAKQGPNDLLGWFSSIAGPISTAAATIGRFGDDTIAKLSGLWGAIQSGVQPFLDFFANIAASVSAAAASIGRFVDDSIAKFTGWGDSIVGFVEPAISTIDGVVRAAKAARAALDTLTGGGGAPDTTAPKPGDAGYHGGDKPTTNPNIAGGGLVTALPVVGSGPGSGMFSGLIKAIQAAALAIAASVATIVAEFGRIAPAVTVAMVASSVAVTVGAAAIGLAFTTMQLAVQTVVTTMATAIQTTFQILAERIGIITGGIQTTATTQMTTMQTSVVTAIQTMAGEVQSALQTMAGEAQGAISTMAGDVRGQTSGMAGEVQGTISGMAGEVQGAIRGMSGEVNGTISGMRGQVAGSISGMAGQVSGAISGMAGQVSGTVSGMAGQVAGIVSGMAGQVAGQIQGMSSQAIGAVQQAASGIIGGFQTASSGAISAVSAMSGQVLGILGGLGSQAASLAYSIGAQIGQGMASGMDSALGAVESAAGAIIAAANQAMQAKAQISSPSKLFKDTVGLPMGWGVAQGLLATIPAVTSAAKQLIGAASAATSTAMNAYIQHIKADGDWLNDALMSIPQGEKFRDAMRAIWNEDPAARAALRKYMDVIIADGDYLNDWLTHLPKHLQATFREWGQYIAQGLEGVSANIQTSSVSIANSVTNANMATNMAMKSISDSFSWAGRNIATASTTMQQSIGGVGSVFTQTARLVQDSSARMAGSLRSVATEASRTMAAVDGATRSIRGAAAPSPYAFQGTPRSIRGPGRSPFVTTPISQAPRVRPAPLPTYIPPRSPRGGGYDPGGGRPPVTVNLNQTFNVTGPGMSEIVKKIKDITDKLPDQTAQQIGRELALRGC